MFLLSILFGSLLLSGLIFINFWLESLQTLSVQTLYLKRGLQAFNVFLCVLVIRRILALCFWKPYRKKFGYPPPHILVSGINLLVIASATIITIVFIFKESLLSITTAGGFLTVGLAVGLQGLIYDGFSGFIIDLDKPYNVGDWIKTTDFVGVVKEIGWRITTLVTNEEITVRIPNSVLLNRELINYSKPQQNYWETLTVTVDHYLPIERVRRILHAAVITVPNIYRQKCTVHATESTPGGIDYQIRFAVENYSLWREAKHQVLVALQKAANSYGFKFSETLGEYTLSKGGKACYELINQPDIMKILRMVDTFKYMTPEKLHSLASNVNIATFDEGQNVVTENEVSSSMFIVAEGVAGVFLNQADGSIKGPINLLKQGEFFGDRSLLLGEPRSATVKGMTGMMLIEITKKQFDSFLRKHQEVINQLSRVIAERDLQNEAIRKEPSPVPDAKLDSFIHKLSHSIKVFFEMDK